MGLADFKVSAIRDDEGNLVPHVPQFEVLLLGDRLQATSFARYFADPDQHLSSKWNGCISSLELDMNGHEAMHVQVHFRVLDCGGGGSKVPRHHFAIILFDVNNEYSYESALKWHETIMSCTPTLPVCVVGDNPTILTNLEQKVFPHQLDFSENGRGEIFIVSILHGAHLARVVGHVMTVLLGHDVLEVRRPRIEQSLLRALVQDTEIARAPRQNLS